MKRGAGLLIIMLLLWFLPHDGMGQTTCIYDNNISDFSADQWCSPVNVVYWNVTYTGVDNDGAEVNIIYDWGDGDIETEPTTESPAGTFAASSDHTYFSEDNICKYFATATLMIDGEICENTTVEKNVPVWDVDNENGAYVRASPNVYPICIGEGATMRFDDDTKYNCVPSQEDDIRNESKRWIQWVYGTNHADADFMTGTPVSVDGYTGPWPYVYPSDPKELPEPSWGSSERSLPITVDDDKLLGQEFEVELRYWNFCNPYPGNDPVIDRSVIRIVDHPDATITPVGILCESDSPINLTAATGGGTWSGNGITNASTGKFSPYVAGPGTHTITYQVTVSGCTSSDTEDIAISAGPDATITPVDPFCIYSAPYDMEAGTSAGTWDGDGIVDVNTGLFDPSLAGFGRHSISFTTAPDVNGCYGTDTFEVAVVDIPSAKFLTPDSSWCEQENNQTTAEILVTGTDSSTFDLIIEMQGTVDTLPIMSNGVTALFLDNQPGTNEYNLIKIIEHHGDNSCEQLLIDALVMQVNPLPVLTLAANYDNSCSPVPVNFVVEPGYNKYSWDFGDGYTDEKNTNTASHTYTYDYTDNILVIDNDTVYDYTRPDTVFRITLTAETSNKCVGTLEDSITVYPNPKARFYPTPPLQHYPDSVVYIYNQSTLGPWDYLWDFGDTQHDTAREPITHIYNLWGFYDIDLIVSSPFCADTATNRVQIMPPPPEAFFEPDTSGCPPLTVSFSNTSLYAETYIWDFDDNHFSSDPNPTHVFYDNREHSVTMAAFGLSGSDTINRTVYVYERPQALFDVYPRESRNLKQNFKFINNTQDATYYLWDFGDGTTSPDPEPNHFYEDSGTYTITLYAFNEHNCADTLVEEAFLKVVAGEGSIDFPTAFVLNEAREPTGGHWDEGTINNNVFHPAVINAVEYKLIIYTRWGVKVFESNDLYIGWDGFLESGNLADEGVYVWKVWVTYVDGLEEILFGDITFLH